ncbi:hypothetical protein PR048_028238 [Dryococelus australis]|uniref:RNA-directed DNA polymerase n=1 Tax=Dryococelus australis TaxID=614101 RepID=A0ABQ9GIQ2_9NEOP|nr:hypothetical protein PR048_028238 [Dryococelus australis]
MSDERKQQFNKATQNDKDLCSLKKLISEGSPVKEKVPQSLKSYFSIKIALVKLKGRLIVPQSLVPSMLNLVHECHFGVTKIKQRAHQCLFWLCMGADIENFTGTCDVCVSPSCNNKKEPLLSYLLSVRHWEKMVSSVDNRSSSSIISKLKFIFAWLGVPDVLVSYNIPFSSMEFQMVLISPRHMHYKSGHDVSYALLEYRNTPIAQVGLSCPQIMRGRTLKSKLPFVVNQLLSLAINYGYTKKGKKIGKSRFVIMNRVQ